MFVDVIIKNGKCLSMENPMETFDWVATKDGIIAGLGKGQSYEKMVGDETQIVDADGNTVLPGFIDSHFHVVQTALNKISLDLSHVTSFEEAGELIREAAVTGKKDMIRGYGLSTFLLEGGEPMTRNVIDRYCNDVPVWINTGEYQVSMLNTYALLYFKIPFTTEGIELDERSVPTGVFRTKANSLLRTNILDSISDTVRWDTINMIMPDLMEKGITTINAMEGGTSYSNRDAEFVYNHEKDFPIDLALFYQTLDIDIAKSKGLKRIGGSLYIDGTFGSRTAAVSFEYADCPGTMGMLCLSQEQINDFVLECYKNDMQLALYTIGDRAIEAALIAHERAMHQEGKTGLRHRLEHVELPTDEQLKRAKDLNIIFSMQPSYETLFGGVGGMYEERLGEKYKLTNPFKQILKEGIRICGGSDSDVTPANPLLGIHSAVNCPVEEHSVSLYEALRMFTYDAAYAIFEEDIKGSLQTGKLADIIVLDCDIFRVDQEMLKDVNVILTMKSGDVMFNVI